MAAAAASTQDEAIPKVRKGKSSADNSIEIIIDSEGKELGSSLQNVLCKDPQVTYAGYRHVNNTLRLNVTAQPDADPLACIAKAVEELQKIFAEIQTQFQAEVERVRKTQQPSDRLFPSLGGALEASAEASAAAPAQSEDLRP